LLNTCYLLRFNRVDQSVLLPTNLGDDDELQEDSSVLPESISISRIEDLLSQMRFHEVPKRSLFSVPFKLGDGFTIGIKGCTSVFILSLLPIFLQFTAGMVWSQNKRKEHINILSILAIEWKSQQCERRMWTRYELSCSTDTTSWYLQDRQADIDKTKIVYGADLGASATADGDEDNEESNGTFGARVVKAGSRVSHFPHGIYGVWPAFPSCSRFIPPKKSDLFVLWVLSLVNAFPHLRYLLPNPLT